MSTTTGFARASRAAGRHGFWLVRDPAACPARGEGHWLVTDLAGRRLGPVIITRGGRNPVTDVPDKGGYRLQRSYATPDAFFTALRAQGIRRAA